MDDAHHAPPPGGDEHGLRVAARDVGGAREGLEVRLAQAQGLLHALERVELLAEEDAVRAVVADRLPGSEWECAIRSDFLKASAKKAFTGFLSPAAWPRRK